MNDHPSRVMSGRAEVQGLQLLESCAFHWIFDGATRRFRRTPRDAMVLDAPDEWSEYHRLEIDDARSCFAVGLDEAGTRVLRAWLHTEPCPHCERDETTVGELRQDIQAWKRRLRVRDIRIAFDGDAGRHPLRPFGGWASAEDIR